MPPWTRSRADAEGAGPQPTAGRWQSWAFGLLLLAAGLHCLRPLWGDDLFWQLANGRLIVTGSEGKRNGAALALVKDPRGPDPGGAPAYVFPPGTPPGLMQTD